MYSPKISEDLIPVLYRLAKANRQPMTRLVDGLIRKALVTEDLRTTAREPRASYGATPDQAVA